MGIFHTRFFLHCELRNDMRYPDGKGKKYQTKTFAFFSEDMFFHNLPPEWFYNVDKMAIFLNDFQLFLFIFFCFIGI